MRKRSCTHTLEAVPEPKWDINSCCNTLLTFIPIIPATERFLKGYYFFLCCSAGLWILLNRVSMCDEIGLMSLSHQEQLQEDVLQDEHYVVLRERESTCTRKSSWTWFSEVVSVLFSTGNQWDPTWLGRGSCSGFYSLFLPLYAKIFCNCSTVPPQLSGYLSWPY